MKTKLFTLFLVIVAGIGSLFASDTQVDGIWYNFNNSNQTASVTYQGKNYSTSNEYSGTINIPEEVTYNNVIYSVTSIGTEAFRGDSDLVSVTIPNSVTSIGSYAFMSCTNLDSITIPNRVTSIGDFAFCGSSLISITIPNSVTSMGNYTFRNCSRLTSVEIGNGITKIGDYAFFNCSLLQIVSIPSSVLSVGENAFRTCTGLTSIEIPDGVTEIKQYAFQGCTALMNVAIPNSVTTIGKWSFHGCSNLTNIEIPSSVTSIGENAFYNCPITDVECLGETPASLGAGAFTYSNNLRIWVRCGYLEAYQSAWSSFVARIMYHELEHQISVNTNISEAGVVYNLQTICDSTIQAVPNYGWHFVQWSDGITDNPRVIELTQDTVFIAEFAVDRTGTCGDDNQLTWTYDPTKKQLTISGNGALNSNYTFGLEAPTNIQKLEIQDGVTSIGSYAFANEVNLASLSLSNTIVSIGDHAFINVKKLTEVTIPASVTEIGVAAFKNGNRLETIRLGAGIESIGDSAFADCPYLLKVHSHMDYPPLINTSVFAGDGDLSLTDLLMPEGALARYKKTAVWKDFNLQVDQEQESSGNEYSITYVGKDNAFIDSEIIKLNLPEAPEIDGFTFQYWKPVSSDITNGITIQAIYVANIPTNAPSVYTNPVNPAQKLLRNGNVYVLTGDKTFTVTGQEVR